MRHIIFSIWEGFMKVERVHFSKIVHGGNCCPFEDIYKIETIQILVIIICMQTIYKLNGGFIKVSYCRYGIFNFIDFKICI